MIPQDQAKKYHQGKKCVFYFGLALDVILLLALQLSGLSGYFRHLSFQFVSFPLAARAVYTVFFCLSLYPFQLAVNYFADYVWEHRFGLSEQNFFDWLTDEIKKGVLGLVLVLVLVEVVYFLLARFPRTWWIGAAGFWLFLSLVLARILPDVIIPMFYKYLPVDDEALRQRIFALFKQCRVKLRDIYAINLSAKTKKANAFVCGLGQNRRVVLSDTLLSDFTSAEIETVVAHELGHDRHHDILKLTLFNSVLVFAAFFLMDLVLIHVLGMLGLAVQDVAGLPVLTLGMMIFGFAVSPVLNAYSRRLETKADAFSLKLTGKKEEFISMMNKLGDRNLAEFSPSRFDEIMFYDHPPIAKRIAMAQRFQPAVAPAKEAAS